MAALSKPSVTVNTEVNLRTRLQRRLEIATPSEICCLGLISCATGGCGESVSSAYSSQPRNFLTPSCWEVTSFILRVHLPFSRYDGGKWVNRMCRGGCYLPRLFHAPMYETGNRTVARS